MKRLHIDCSMGAAGDMLAAALLELHPDPDSVLRRLNAAGIPGTAFRREPALRGGIAGTRLVVTVEGHSEEPAHDHPHPDTPHPHFHPHPHPHPHPHAPHRTLADVLALVDTLALPAPVRADAAAIYRLIAQAESRVHGRPVGEVHFHELGALDAVADIAAVCLLMTELAPAETTATPVNVGGGTVHTAHGLLPVPAPATALLLEGIPTRGDPDLPRELCTPTGAALLRHYVAHWGPQPPMVPSATGHGAGTADFPGRANLLRCTLGEAPDPDAPPGDEDILELACNLDDMTGEELAYAADRLFEAGALDVAILPATMKKGRPGHLLTALCAPADRQSVLTAMFRHTTTLGIRARTCRRWVLTRREDTVTLPDGATLRRKISTGHGIRRAKYESDDLSSLARTRNIPLRDLLPTLPPP